jgi:hypothetical protein
MNPLQLAILAFLQENGVGRQNAINADAIFDAMVQQGLAVISGRTQEHIRDSVRSMIKDFGQLIGSESGFHHPNGYYIIQNRDEVISTIINLLRRSQSMLNRAESLRAESNMQNPTNTI